MAVVDKRNFTRGIFSPVVASRRDVEAWTAGAKRLVNVHLLKHGGVRKRPGTELVFIQPKDDADTRMLPFTYSTGQSYILLMGQGTMRPIAQGGMVVEPGFGITAISKEVRGTVTAPYHGLATGDQVFLSGIEGMIELNGRTVTVEVIDASRFYIDVDTRKFTTFSGDSGTVRTAEPDPPAPPPVVPEPTQPPPPAPTIPPGGGGGYLDPHQRFVLPY